MLVAALREAGIPLDIPASASIWLVEQATKPAATLLLQVLLRGILADPAVAEGVPLVPQPVPPPSRTWPV